MQTALKIFEVLPLGTTSIEGLQKIAVKLPAKDGAVSEQDAAGFMEIMSALLSLKPDQWQASLKQLDWVHLQGEPEELAPMIDLSDPKDKERVVFELLNLMLPQQATSKARASAEECLDGSILSQVPPTKGQATELMLAAVLRNARMKHRPTASGAISGGSAEEKNPAGADELILATGTGKEPNKGAPEAKPEAASASVRKVLSESPPVLEALLPDPQAPAAKKQNVSEHKAGDGSKAQFQKPQVATRPLMPTAAVGNEAQAPGIGKNTELGPVKAAEENAADHAQQIMTVNREETAESGSDSKPLLARHSIQADMAHSPSSPQRGHAASSAPAPNSSSSAQQMQHDVIRQIVQRMTLHSDKLQSHMQIKLKPEFLGDLHMHITTENHQVMIRMTTDSVAVKEMIEQNLVHLRNELQQHGLVIHKFDVFVGQEDDGWKNAQQQAAFGHDRQRRQQRSRLGGSRQAQSKPVLAPEVLPNRSTLYSKTAEVDFFA